MKTTTAFVALHARHQNEANAKKNFMVRRVNKNGTVSQSSLTQVDWQLNAFVDRESADSRVVTLEAMNPGSKYIVTTL